MGSTWGIIGICALILVVCVVVILAVCYWRESDY